MNIMTNIKRKKIFIIVCTYILLYLTNIIINSSSRTILYHTLNLVKDLNEREKLLHLSGISLNAPLLFVFKYYIFYNKLLRIFF